MCLDGHVDFAARDAVADRSADPHRNARARPLVTSIPTPAPTPTPGVYVTVTCSNVLEFTNFAYRPGSIHRPGLRGDNDRMTAFSRPARPSVALAHADRGTFGDERDGLWPCFAVMDETQTAIRRYLW